MAIEWREEMSIDNGAIDRDHRELIRIINRFEALVEGQPDATAIVNVLTSLQEFARQHFGREEALQRQLHFPFEESHRVAHKRLMRRVETLAGAGGVAAIAADPRFAERVAELLREWLIYHVLKADLHLRPYFQRAQRSGAITAK